MASFEIVALSDSVSYVPSLSNVGLWAGPEGTVLIDSGNDAEAGRRILRSLENSGRKLSAVFLTHSNADHAGGAAALVSRSGVPIYASRIESSLCADPILEPSFVWGGFPPRELKNKFFVAPSCAVSALSEDGSLPPALAGAAVIPLPGHFFSQCGFLADGVLFAGDALFGTLSIEKHPVFFVYDVAAFLSSLDKIAAAGARMVIPSHGTPTEDVASLISINRAAVERAASVVGEACAGGASFEDVLAFVCVRFGIKLDWAQYALVGSTVRSYLVYLREQSVVDVEFSDGRMLWRAQ
ncbi:MAG: MBL fold metallo-hydrolase [Treponemataceae bacterium]